MPEKMKDYMVGLVEYNCTITVFFCCGSVWLTVNAPEAPLQVCDCIQCVGMAFSNATSHVDVSGG